MGEGIVFYPTVEKTFTHTLQVPSWKALLVRWNAVSDGGPSSWMAGEISCRGTLVYRDRAKLKYVAKAKLCTLNAERLRDGAWGYHVPEVLRSWMMVVHHSSSLLL